MLLSSFPIPIPLLFIFVHDIPVNCLCGASWTSGLVLCRVGCKIKFSEPILYVGGVFVMLRCACVWMLLLIKLLWIYVLEMFLLIAICFCWADSDLAVVWKKVDDFYFSVTRLKNVRSKRWVQLFNFYIHIPPVNCLWFHTWTSLFYVAELLFFTYLVLNFWPFCTAYCDVAELLGLHVLWTS